MIENLRGTLAVFSQIICYPIFWFLAYVLSSAEVKDYLLFPDDKDAIFVIAANHQSRLDPFILTGIIRPKYWKHLLPYRYITANQYLYYPGFVWFLWPLGGFPSSATRIEEYGLKRALNIVNHKQTVCIFPEGQRSVPNEIEPKKGVAVLASIPNVYVIPIYIRWQNPKIARKVRITIGKPYRANGQSPQQIMKKIYNLS